MKYIREQDVEGDRIGPPHQRVIRHLVTPENMGSKFLWLGTSSVDPGFKSNAHAHEDQEEVFYCVSGQGRIKVDDEEAPLEPGAVVFCPPKFRPPVDQRRGRSHESGLGRSPAFHPREVQSRPPHQGVMLEVLEQRD